MQTDIAHVFGIPSHVNKHGVTRQSKSVTRKNLKCMVKVLRKYGFSGFNGQSWYTYLLFYDGSLWALTPNYEFKKESQKQYLENYIKKNKLWK